MIKRLLPRSLFGRALLVLVTPVVLLQIVSAFVFFDRHLETITRRLATGLAGEIGMVIEALEEHPDPVLRERILDSAYRNMQIIITLHPNERLPSDLRRPPFYHVLERLLSGVLEDRLGLPYQIDARSFEEHVEIKLQVTDGVLRVLTREKRLFSSTTYIFLMWMVGASIVLLIVASIFLNNQIRPIRRLAQAADSFGKGRDVADFRPAGAAEIRRAARAFLVMKERIRRQISQRTEMLAGVSHDLRTPLTRMKLQLAMLASDEATQNLKEDVAEMERMIAGYLAFARGQDSETAVATDLPELLGQVVNDARRQGGHVHLEVEAGLIVPVRPNAFKRCLTNLVENALRHAQRVEISARSNGDMVEIAVDDDGPGIPEDQRNDAFRPFMRIDKSRNPATGGVGLGLTIARDVIRAHGGDITLLQAPTGGLRALLKLPV